MEKVVKPHTARRQADATVDVAVELWRAARYGEACALLRELLAGELRPRECLRARLALAMCLRALGLFEEAQEQHKLAAPLADGCSDLALRGKAYHGRAVTLQNLSDTDGAIEDFTAASYYYERAGARDLRRDVENNLAVLLVGAGFVEEAASHLEIAQRGVCIPEIVAQFEDTEALVALARKDATRALGASASSVVRLLRLDEPRLLSKSVETLLRAAREWKRDGEAQRLRDALNDCGWNSTRAAAALGFKSRQALANHLRRHFPEVAKEKRNRSVASRRKR